MKQFREVLLCFVALLVSWSINAQESGLVVKSPQQLTLHKFKKLKKVLPVGITLRVTTISKLKGSPIKYAYKGIFLRNEGTSLSLQLIEPPEMLSPNLKVDYNKRFKRDTLPQYDLFIEDIEQISVFNKKTSYAKVRDGIGYLGMLTFSGSTYFFARLRHTRPDLVSKRAVPLSILGIGLSYLLTRVGHVKNYRMKARKKGKNNFWTIK